MIPAALYRLSGLLDVLGKDGAAFAAAAASAALLVLLALAFASYRAGRRARGAREQTLRRATGAPTARDLEMIQLRARLNDLEKALQELREAVVARPGAAEASAPAAPAPAAAAVPETAATGPAALVCAADPRRARVYESMLKERGLRVRVCADGADAAALAAADKPVLTVMELASAGAVPLSILRSLRAAIPQGGRLLAIAANETQFTSMATPGVELLAAPLDLVDLARRLRGGAAPVESKR